MSILIDNPELKYLGQSETITGERKILVQTWQGSKELISNLKDTYSIHQVTEYGSLEGIEMTQDEGPYWNLTLQWESEFNGISIVSSNDSVKSTLSINMMSLDLESAKKYRKRWNYALCFDKDMYDVPEVASKYTKAQIEAALNELWDDDGKRKSDSKVHEDILGDKYPDLMKYIIWTQDPSINNLASEIITEDGTKHIPKWYRKYMTKPGVTSYDYPMYELNEIQRCSTKAKAGVAISKIAGRITVPKYGDFGIVGKLGGNWLCLGGTISYDGKRWIAQLRYQHSPDGWDDQLYEDEIKDSDKLGL